MQAKELWRVLRDFFPVEDYHRLISAFIHDDILYQGMLNDELFQNAEQLFGRDLNLWTPACLGLLSIGVTSGIDCPSQISFNQNTLIEAREFFESLPEKNYKLENIQQAAWLAVILKDRTSQNGNLSITIHELIAEGKQGNSPYELWKTPLTMLYGLLEKPEDLLKSLLAKRGSYSSLAWIAHVVLCQPISTQRKAELIHDTLVNAPLSQQLSLMLLMKARGCAELVRQVSAAMLQSRNPAVLKVDLQTIDQLDVENLVLKALECQRLALLCQLAGQKELAESLLSFSEKAYRQNLAGITCYGTGIDLEDPCISQKGSATTALVYDQFLATAGKMMIESERSTADDITVKGLLVEIIRAKALAEKGELDTAVQTCRKAVEALGEVKVIHISDFQPRYGIDWNPELFLEILHQMHLEQEALRLAKVFLKYRPSDSRLLNYTSRLAEGLGDKDTAMEFAISAVGILPESASENRWLAQLSEKYGLWEDAHRQYNLVIKLVEKAQPGDWEGLARAAFATQQMEECILACDSLLAKESNHPLACSLKGQILMAGGKTADGLRFLKKAAILEPENPVNWLCIADYHAAQQDHKKVIEVCKSAMVSCPKSERILHRLAQSYIFLHQHSEARLCLENASEISSDNEEIVIDLGRVLIQLGDYESARKLYRQALTKWENNIGLLTDFARSAMILGELLLAIECLEKNIQAGNASLELRKQYLNLLFANEFTDRQLEMDNRRLRFAARVFSDLPLAKDDVVFKCYRADNCRRMGEDRKAILIYQELVQNSDIHTAGFVWRVKAGLAEIVMKTGHFVDAILLMEEAISEKPENVFLKQKLATYYLLNHLPEQAAAAAKEVIKMLPDNPECLTWYADFQVQMGNKHEAVRALEDALRLSGNYPHLWVALAEVYMRVGDTHAAQKILARYPDDSDIPDEIIVRIARVYWNMGLIPETIHFLERKKNIDQNERLAVGVILGVLYLATGNPLGANEKIMELLNIDADFIINQVLLAECHEAQGQYQSAIEVLEKALLSVEVGKPANERMELIEELDILSEGEIRKYHSLAEIHLRLARLFRLMGDLAASFNHIRIALEEEPGNLQYRAAAIELAQAQLKYNLASQLADEIGEHFLSEDDPKAILSIIGFQAESALDNGDYDKAEYWINHGLRVHHQSSRMVAAQARLMSRRGEIQKAQSLISSIKPLQVGDELWLADAYLDCRLWNEALQVFDRFVVQHPENLHGKNRLARVHIHLIETARLYAELDAVTHAPGSNLSEHVLLEKVLRLVSEIKPALGGEQDEILTWRAKGAFAPSRESFINLVDRDLTPELVSSLVAQARWLGLPRETIDFAKTYLMYPEVCIQLAISLQNNDPEVGVNIARQAVSMMPADPIGYCVQARLYKSNRNYRLALESLETALSIWGDEPRWHYQAAEVARIVEDYEAVTEHLMSAVALRPDCVAYRIDLSKVWLEVGKTEEAIEILQEAVRREPYYEEAWIQLAIANRQAGRFEEAIKCASYAVSINPHSMPALIIGGRTAMDLGRHEEALRFANSTLRLDPDHIEGILLAANALEASKRYQEAMAVLERALTSNENPILFQEKARMLAENQGVKPAIAYLKSVHERLPENPNLLKQLAELLYSAGNYREAELYAHQALRLSPESAEINFLVGMLQRKAGNLDKSIRHLSEAILRNPAGIDAYLELAKAYQQRRDHYESLKIYQQAINLCPNDHRVYFGAAGVLKDSKDYLGAEVMLRKAAELAPEDLDIRRQLGAVIALNLVHNSQEVQSPL